MIPFPESWHATLTMLVLVGVFVSFLREALAPELIALCALAMLMVMGILEPAEGFALFGNNAIVTISCMFILSVSLSKTGALAPVSRLLLRSAQKGEKNLLGSLFGTAIPLSGFINNTPLIAVLVPILRPIAATTGIPLSRLLIPASYATVLGGTLTLIGTSTNLVVSSSAKSHGLAPFTLFETTGLGVIYALAGVLYLLTIGHRLLPTHPDLPSADELDEDPPTTRAQSPRKKWISLGTILIVVTLAGAGIGSIGLLTMCGALVVVLTKCLSLEDAYRAIPWNLVFLITGMLGLGLAMEKSGASALIVNALTPFISPAHPIIALSIVYLITTILTEMVSNNAVAALLTPIAISVAHQAGVDPRPFVVAVMFGASASFATPVGYQTNTYIYSLGGYSFRDFIKVGLPLNIILWGVATLVIPLIWKFH